MEEIKFQDKKNSNSTKKLKIIYILSLIVICFSCYANTFFNGFVWDDINNVLNNDQLSKSEGVRDIFLNPSDVYYRPISYLTLKIDYFFWQENVFGYHLTNVLFHTANALLVFLLAMQLGLLVKGAFFSALFFAIHPVQTESVAYISGRSDVICTFFMLVSFLFFLSYLEKEQTKLLIISLLVSVFTYLSKEVALVLPLLIIGVSLDRAKGAIGKKLLKAMPHFLLGSLFIIFVQKFVRIGYLYPELKFKINNMFKFLLYYLKLLILPINLHMQHNINESWIIANMPFALSCVIFFVIFLSFRKIIKLKNYDFCWYWFLIGLFPFWGLLNYGADIAEHWLYLPCIGLLILAGDFMSKSKRKIIKPILIGVVVTLSILTLNQNMVWRDDLILYKYNLEFNPDHVKLNYNLGNAYLRRNMLKQAEQAYLHTLQLQPDYAYALNNLGIVYERQNKFEAALKSYKSAKELDEAGNYHEKNISRIMTDSVAFAQEVVKKEKFDHRLYGEVLNKFLKNGLVDYKQLRKDPILLLQYLNQIAKISADRFAGFSRDEKMSLYINAYNGFTLKAIIDHYPVESIKNIPGVWEKLEFTFAGQKITLNEIEHKILRSKFHDPRVHFALVCAARGCPRLNSKPFTAERLNEMLDLAGKNFLRDKFRNRLDREKNILYLSAIFKWFKDDFGNVLNFISKYLKPEDVEFIKNNNPKIKYQYNWQLNEQNY